MTKGSARPFLLPVVAAAMVDEDGRVLLQRRPAGGDMAGLWEFPGGKLEAGESPEAALSRELEEELAVTVASADLAPACFASAPLNGRHLLLLLYVVRRWTGSPRALAASELAWVRLDEMGKLAMPPADEPLIGLLRAVLDDAR